MRGNVEWVVGAGLTPYLDAVAAMERHAEAIRAENAPERVWLVEHPPLYTTGTSADGAEILAPDTLPVFATGRGGRTTYHGPGQRVAYTMLDLTKRGRDVRGFVHQLEEWVILSLAEFGVAGERREGRVGIWVRRDSGEDKIAAIGVRIRRWVTFHGIAVNVHPNLGHFDGIVPCGIRGYGVTSLDDLGVRVTVPEFDRVLRRTFTSVFERS